MPVPCPPVPLHERTEDLDEGPLHWWEAGDAPSCASTASPTRTSMWRDFLACCGGVAVDLPGFGLAGKRGDLDYSIAVYDRFLERFLDHLGWERVRLVVHDWGGAVGARLRPARPRAGRAARDDRRVPLLPGYRWHRMARLWRARGGRRARHGRDQPAATVGCDAQVRRPARGLRRRGVRTLRPGHAARDPQALPLRARGRAGRGWPRAWRPSTCPSWSSGATRTRTSRPASGTALPTRWATPPSSTFPTPATGPGSTAPTSSRGCATGSPRSRGLGPRRRRWSCCALLLDPGPALRPRRCDLARRTVFSADGFTLWDERLVRRPPHARATPCSSRRWARSWARSCSGRWRRWRPRSPSSAGQPRLRERAAGSPRRGSRSAAAANLFTGRLTFTLGMAIGLSPLVAWQRQRILLALLLALLTGLASPVAGLFLGVAAWPGRLSACGCAASAGEEPRQRGASVGARQTSSGAGVAVLMLLCATVAAGASSRCCSPRAARAVRPDLVPAAAWGSSVLLAVRAPTRGDRPAHRARPLRDPGRTAAFVFDTPFGGNAARLGALFAGPVLAAAVLGRRDTARLAHAGAGRRRPAARCAG